MNNTKPQNSNSSKLCLAHREMMFNVIPRGAGWYNTTDWVGRGPPTILELEKRKHESVLYTFTLQPPTVMCSTF